MSEQPMTWDDLPILLEQMSPSSLAAHLDADRPYDGQPHTDLGERGSTEVKGVTFRDLRDCFVRACYESSGLPIEEWPGSVYDLPDLDLIAVAQNLACNVEKRMGIYPNLPHMDCPCCRRSVTTLHPDLCWDCTFPDPRIEAGRA